MELAAHHLPPERSVGPRGGRPPLDNRGIVKVLWFVLTAACRWEDGPPALGGSGRTAQRFLPGWEERGGWDRLHADLLRRLRQAGKLDPDLVSVAAVIGRALGGGADRPQPRGPPEKRHETHAAGGPARGAAGHPHGGPNASDHRQIIPLVLDFPKVTGKPGRPKELPDTLYADRGYDRLAVIQDAWDTRAAWVICFRLLHDDDTVFK